MEQRGAYPSCAVSIAQRLTPRADVEHGEWSPQSEQQHLRRSVVMLLRTLMVAIVLAAYLWAAVCDNSTPRAHAPSGPAPIHAASIAPLHQPRTPRGESHSEAADFELRPGYGA